MVSACFRQVCKRHRFAVRKVVFQKTKDRVLRNERTPFQTVTATIASKQSSYLVIIDDNPSKP